MFCRNCGIQADEDALFCKICGIKLSESINNKYCFNCGSDLDDDAIFCMYCGTKIKENEESTENKENYDEKRESLTVNNDSEKQITQQFSENRNDEPAKDTPKTDMEYEIIEKDLKTFAVVKNGNPNNYYCPNCHQQVNLASANCRKCGIDFYHWDNDNTLREVAASETPLTEKPSESEGQAKDNNLFDSENNNDKLANIIGITILIITFLGLLIFSPIRSKNDNEKTIEITRIYNWTDNSTYLDHSKITYLGIDYVAKNIPYSENLYVRIIDSENKMMTGSESPVGYTLKTPASSTNIGWGNDNPGVYAKGNYIIQFFYNERQLCEKDVYIN